MIFLSLISFIASHRDVRVNIARLRELQADIGVVHRTWGFSDRTVEDARYICRNDRMIGTVPSEQTETSINVFVPHTVCFFIKCKVIFHINERMVWYCHGGAYTFYPLMGAVFLERILPFTLLL